MRLRPAFVAALSLPLILDMNSPRLIAQGKTEITVDWICSDASAELTAVPLFAWLDDTTALLYDTRRPRGERTLEKLDLRSGKREPAIDLERALAGLNALRSADDSVHALDWPDAIDGSGKFALYSYNDDIYLLDLTTSAFSAVTRSDAAEKSASFSPDGSMIAFVRDNDLYTYDIVRRSETRLTFDGSETVLNGTLSWVYWEEIFGRRDIGYWWSEDSRAIAYLQTDESPVAVMHFVDYRPYVPAVITQRYPKAGTDNPRVKVGVAEIANGGTTWIDFSGVAYEYIARVNWFPDSRRLCVQTMNRAQTQLDLYSANRASGEVTHIMQESDSAWVNINDDLYFLGDGEEFIWQSERDGFAHLYRFSSDGRLLNQITRGEWALRSSGGVFWLRQSVMAIDEKNEWIYFTALRESPLERHLYRIQFNGGRLERLSRESGTHRISFSPGARYYFDTFSDNHTPPSLSLHRADGALLQRLAEPRLDLLAGLDFQYPELFTIPTSDGFQMPAELLKPADFDPGERYPLIYNVYGGPSAPTVFNAWNTDWYYDQILLKRGYLVVRFDHRAATAISKTLENRLLGMMSGPRELSDIIDGVRWLKAQPYVDGDRFGIWGWSGGGSFTLNAMTNSREFKAGISVAPVTDWRYYDSKWAEFGMKLPQDNAEGYEKTSFVRSARNLHGRLLLIHGTYDDNVHPQNSWAFIEELIQANIPFDMMFYPMRKHGISDRPARIHLYNKMLEYWSEHL